MRTSTKQILVLAAAISFSACAADPSPVSSEFDSSSDVDEDSNIGVSDENHNSTADADASPLSLIWSEKNDGTLLVGNAWMEPIVVDVTVVAKLGVLRRELVSQRIEVAPRSTMNVGFDLNDASSIHAAQKENFTSIEARVTTIRKDGFNGHSVRAEYRYLTPVADSPNVQLLNRLQLHEYAAQAGYNQPTGPIEEDGISMGVGSGVMYSRAGGIENLAFTKDGVEIGDDFSIVHSSSSSQLSSYVTNPTNVTMCFLLDPAYNDVGGGEDFWTDSSDRSARGIRVKVLRQNGTIAWGGTNGTYTDSNGCTPALNLTGGPFRIRLYSEAQVGSGTLNTITVRTSEADNERYYFDATTAEDLISNSLFISVWRNSDTPVIADMGDGETDDVVNILAAAAQSIHLYPLGQQGKTIRIYNSTSTDPECDGSCTWDDPSNTNAARVFLSETGRGSKYIISHETGHAMVILANQGQRAIMSNSGVPTSGNFCRRNGTSHNMFSREYQSRAAHEGIAHAYAALVWNDDSEINCVYGYYKNVNFDGDTNWGENSNPDESNPWISCEDAGNYGNWFLGSNYLETECPTPHTNRATEYDWLRFWWDMIVDFGLSPATMADIWDGANPHTWDTDGAVYNVIRTSAFAELSSTMETSWDSVANMNGVNN